MTNKRRSFNKTNDSDNKTQRSAGSQIQEEEEKGGESLQKEANLSPSGGMSNIPSFTLISNPNHSSINLYIQN